MSETNENARLEMFSDGVFAIAITLLILEIKIPALDSIHSISDLWKGIIKLSPSYFAFMLSFTFIFIAWGNHHVTFKLVDKSSGSFIYANGLLLLSLAFLPFPTAMLARYITTAYVQPAVVFYSLCSLVFNISWNLLYESILNPKPLTKDASSTRTIKVLRRNARYGFVITLVTTALAWWYPLVALSINTLLYILWIKMSITRH